MQFINVENVVFRYDTDSDKESAKPVLKELSLSVDKGEFVIIKE